MQRANTSRNNLRQKPRPWAHTNADGFLCLTISERTAYVWYERLPTTIADLSDAAVEAGAAAAGADAGRCGPRSCEPAAHPPLYRFGARPRADQCVADNWRDLPGRGAAQPSYTGGRAVSGRQCGLARDQPAARRSDAALSHARPFIPRRAPAGRAGRARRWRCRQAERVLLAVPGADAGQYPAAARHSDIELWHRVARRSGADDLRAAGADRARQLAPVRRARVGSAEPRKRRAVRLSRRISLGHRG